MKSTFRKLPHFFQVKEEKKVRKANWGSAKCQMKHSDVHYESLSVVQTALLQCITADQRAAWGCFPFSFQQL